MNRYGQIAISRRALLQGAAAGTGLLILQPAAAFGAPHTSPSKDDTSALDAYVSATTFSGFTNLDGIRDEYREAVSIFPLSLPPGWAFPAEPSLKDSEPDVEWERGVGVAEVYLYWQSAVATAAYEAYLQGDSAGVERFLDILESGYNTSARRAVIADAASGSIEVEIENQRNGYAGAVSSARRGEFGILKRVSID